jgi:hypothetical protein
MEDDENHDQIVLLLLLPGTLTMAFVPMVPVPTGTTNCKPLQETAMIIMIPIDE